MGGTKRIEIYHTYQGAKARVHETNFFKDAARWLKVYLATFVQTPEQYHSISLDGLSLSNEEFLAKPECTPEPVKKLPNWRKHYR